MQIFFAQAQRQDVVYWCADNRRQPGEPLKCASDFTVGPPSAKSGTYQLYLRAPEGALGNVKGSISLTLADAA